MKILRRICSGLLLTCMIILLVGVLSFHVLIVAGASPALQTTWICSAMRTMSHKYLATVFFSDAYIQSVMDANEVDDSGHDSDILTFKPKETEADAPAVTPQTETEETEPPVKDTQKAEEDAVPEQPSPTEPEKEPAVVPLEKEEPETEPETNIETEKKPPVSYSQEDTPIPEWTEIAADNYEGQGYSLLGDGLYLKEVSGLTWRGYVMLVQDPLRVKLADTSQQYVCGENVMTMTSNVGGVAGINGGGFTDGPNYDSNGGAPAGLIIENGNLVWPLELDNTVYNMIGINADGALVLRHCTGQWAMENDIVSAVSFAPFLVVNGEGLIKEGSGGWGIAPRTAIGQRKTGEFLLLVIDGRQADWSIGCDLDVLQKVMLEEGAHNAAMLDGGSSTAMVYNGEYINRPSLGHERWINNCFVVMPKQNP